MAVIEERLETPVFGEYDVIVAGGGVAGVCAAVAAKRAGAGRVLLLEKGVLLGGLATQGLIALYEPLCDGRGRKITFGMAAELMQLCMRYGPDTLPEAWRGDPDTAPPESGRYRSFYSPAIFALALDAFVQDAGVELLLDTQAVRPVMEGRRCAGLVVENKTGRGFYGARAVIDTTGDADLFYRAGAPCVAGKNFLTCVAYRADMDALRDALSEGSILKARRWTRLGAGPRGKGHPEGAPMLSGTTAEEVTQFVLAGRRMLLDSLRKEDRFRRDISALPAMAQFRTTRHIDGAYTIQDSDACRELVDSVGVIPDFTQADRWHELPYRALYHPDYPNLWTAGRTAAAEGWAWSVIRVIPGAACSGQAAGMAAALSLRHGETAATLPPRRLIDALRAEGVRPHLG